jgi:hypothetical protein
MRRTGKAAWARCGVGRSRAGAVPEGMHQGSAQPQVVNVQVDGLVRRAGRISFALQGRAFSPGGSADRMRVDLNSPGSVVRTS